MINYNGHKYCEKYIIGNSFDISHYGLDCNETDDTGKDKLYIIKTFGSNHFVDTNRIPGKKLKELIGSGALDIINLQITTDNKLVYRNPCKFEHRNKGLTAGIYDFAKEELEVEVISPLINYCLYDSQGFLKIRVKEKSPNFKETGIFLLYDIDLLTRKNCYRFELGYNIYGAFFEEKDNSNLIFTGIRRGEYEDKMSEFGADFIDKLDLGLKNIWCDVKAVFANNKPIRLFSQIVMPSSLLLKGDNKVINEIFIQLHRAGIIKDEAKMKDGYYILKIGNNMIEYKEIIGILLKYKSMIYNQSNRINGERVLNDEVYADQVFRMHKI